MTTTIDEQTTSPSAAFTHVMSTAIEVAAAKLSQKADGWTDKLNDVAAGGGGKDVSAVVGDAVGDAGGDLANAGLDSVAEGGDAKQQAGAKGLQAGLQGKNPIWAAIKGAWTGGSAKVRAAIVTSVVAMVLMLVVSPVLLLVFLLSLLIIAAVAKARPTKKKK